MSRSGKPYGLFATILLIIGMLSACRQGQQQPPVRVEVTLQQMQFTPSEIEVRIGDTVVFINKGIVIHDITEETRKAWTSGPIPAGKSFALVVQEPASYFCSLHPVMKGKITVRR